jgi:pyridoxamine 5'-phosphate oxidase-like protein
MSQLIGDRIPAPLRFELGVRPAAGETARAVLLATVDADGTPRVAILSTAEIAAPDERTLRFELCAGTTTCANLAERKKVAVWYVLDAAAYTVKGTAALSERAGEDGWCSFDVAVEAVWQDFEPGAPMVSGPTYRVPSGD